MGKKIGIDLGTTYSCVSYVDDEGMIRIVDNIEGEQTTPSVVYFDPEDNSVVVGSTAKSEGAMHPECVVERVKNYMGNPDYRCYVNGQEYSAAAVSTLILRKLIADTEQALGEDIDGAVITCPAYFGEEARAATKMAGENVTLKNGEKLKALQILDEPTAAAIAYGNAKKEDMDKKVLIYDLGGGTFDCTIMSLSLHGAQRNMQVITTNGNHQLGGKDWDAALTKLVCEKFCEATGEDIDSMENDPDMKVWFSENMEKAKRNLTSRESTSLTVNYNGKKERIEITRAQFDEATASLLDETILLVNTMMEQKGMSMDKDIDEIILVGGSTYMPQVTERLKVEYNKPIVSYEPNKAVAMGAAYFASGYVPESASVAKEGEESSGAAQLVNAKTGETTNVILTCTKSYGIRYFDRNLQKEQVLNLILKDTPKPAHGSTIDHFPLVLTNSPEKINEVSLLVVEDDSLEEIVQVEDCAKIYVEEPIKFDGEVPGNDNVSIELDVDINGIVSLKLNDLTANTTYHMTPWRNSDETNKEGQGMEIQVGIDLGTTYSAVAFFDEKEGRVRVLKNGLGADFTPSVVCIQDGEVLIGEGAKAEQRNGNPNTIAFYKSMMGNDQWVAFLDGADYTAEDLSDYYLVELIRDIEKANNVTIKKAVITCPAYFNEHQREATIHAAERAGLTVLKILNEPTAAIIAYGLTSGKDKNVLVYDLGGGTFDVTIAHVHDTAITVLATNGNHQLGGRDWDRVLFEMVQRQFLEENGVDIQDFPGDSNELMVKCEEAKKRLTSLSSTQISLMCDGILGKYTVTRESFEEETSVLLNETLLLVESCFHELAKERGNFGWKDIDEVVLVGGSTRMPQVRSLIEREFGRHPITKDINVDTIVACGAAMQAHLSTYGQLVLNPGRKKAGGTSGMLIVKNQDIQDITSHSLGMLALSQGEDKHYINSLIIPKNSLVNKTFSRDFTFQGEEMEVFILQGESRQPEECEAIGEYVITGMKEGRNQLVVDYLYDQNGIVKVDAHLQDGTPLTVHKRARELGIDAILEILEIRRKKAEEERIKNSRLEIQLLIDVSGSMSGQNIEEAKKAALSFLDRFDWRMTYLRIVLFADRTQILGDFSNAKDTLKEKIGRIRVDGHNGYGTSAMPIKNSLHGFSKVGKHVLIVLTDGFWDKKDAETKAANEGRASGVLLYGIGIGKADEGFLDRISGGHGKKVDLSELTKTFREVADLIATEVQNNALWE